MTEFSLTFLTFLTEPPGNLVYHLVLVFALSITIQSILQQKNQQVSSAFKRILIALISVLFLQCLFFLAAIFTWQGMASQRLIIPPLDRVISTLSLIILLWAAIFPESDKAADWISTALCLAVIGLSVFSFTAWQVEYAKYNFNYSWLDWSWSILTAFVLIACILLTLTRKEKNRLFILIFINLNLFGYLAQLLWGSDTADYSIFIRLAQLASFPLLPSLYLNRLKDKQNENFLSTGRLEIRKINDLFAGASNFQQSDEIKIFAGILSETLQCDTLCFCKTQNSEITASLFLINEQETRILSEKSIDSSEIIKFLPIFHQRTISPGITKNTADFLSYLRKNFSQKLECKELFTLSFSLSDEPQEGILLLYKKPLKRLKPEIITLLTQIQESIHSSLPVIEDYGNTQNEEKIFTDQINLVASLKNQLISAENKITLLEKRLLEKPDQMVSEDMQELIELEKESQKIISNLRQDNQKAQKVIQRLQDEIGLYNQNIQHLQQEISDANRIIQNLENQKNFSSDEFKGEKISRQVSDVSTLIDQNIDKISFDLLEKNINLQLDLPEKLSGKIYGKNELDKALQQLLLISKDLILPNGILRLRVTKNLTKEFRDIIIIEIINEKIRPTTNSEELLALQNRLNTAETILKSIDANFENKKTEDSNQYLIQIPMVQEFPG